MRSRPLLSHATRIRISTARSRPDVINSVSIDALWSTGDTTAARRIAEETARSGPAHAYGDHPPRTSRVTPGCRRFGTASDVHRPIVGAGCTRGVDPPVCVVGVRTHRCGRLGDGCAGRANRFEAGAAATRLADSPPADNPGAGTPLPGGSNLLRGRDRGGWPPPTAHVRPPSPRVNSAFSKLFRCMPRPPLSPRRCSSHRTRSSRS